MPEYAIFLSKSARKQLDKLPTDVVETIVISIQVLTSNPYPKGCKKLKGRNGYRIRSGNYRVIYEVIDNKLLIDVIAIGHRKDIYE